MFGVAGRGGIALGEVVLLAGWPALAQLAAPNERGVAMGHVHLVVQDLEAQKNFWTSLMGGTAIRGGPVQQMVQQIRFPGVILVLEKGEPSGPAAGSAVDHFGFSVRDMAGFLEKCRQNGVKVDGAAKADPIQVFVNAPEGVRVEIIRDPAIATPFRMNHLHFYTSEIPEMQAWYAKTFGALAGKRTRVTGPGTLDAADMPGSNISLARTEKPPAPTKGRVLDHIGFEVRNLDAFVKELEAQGIRLDRPVRQFPDSVKAAFLTDPWGIYIELTEGLGR